MAPLKIQKIVSFSSEDPLYPASNLLGKGKWKCKDEGEKQAWVLFQLEELSTITNIDLGNAGSAFIEVQVGRQGGDLNNMKVLLVASSFMSVNEARVGDQQGRVKMLGPDKLAAEVAKEKWDMVKVVATQPFNKQTRFGLSFIALGGTGKEVTEIKTEKVNKLGAFKLKADSVSDISVGSYFSKKKEESASPSNPSSVAAALRKETTLAEATLARAKKEDKKRKLEISPAGMEELKRRKVNTPLPSRQSLPGEPSVSESPKLKQRDKNKADSFPLKNTPNKDLSDKKIKDKVETSKQNKKKVKPQRYEKFRQMLRGVHFTISGFQNPLRGEIRKKGLEMGAEYHGDWNSSCTHLICAFTNTPKFNQVKGKGKIVKKEWLEECHSMRKRLPWRRFCLDKKDKELDESEEEIWEEESKQDNYDCDTDEEIERIQAEELEEKKKKVNQGQSVKSEEEPTSSSSSYKITDFGENKENLMKEEKSDAYNCDTDDENEPCIKTDEEENPYDVETDIDDEEVKRLLPDTSDLSFDILSNHFEGHNFFFHGSFVEDEMELLERYVISSGGKVKLYMDPDVNIVITKVKDERQFKEAKKVNQDVKFLLPKWIFCCNDSKKLIPSDDYSL